VGRVGGPLQQIFLRYAPEYMAEFGDRMPLSHQRALFNIAACRTEAMGGHKKICCDCEAKEFVPHSCKHALCAACHNLAIDDWLAARANELLPGPYFHVTFPLPKELREPARSHQNVVLAAMMRAAAEALQTLAEDRLGGRLGIMTVLHTWGRTLTWHPHVHCLIPGFVVCPDGEFKMIKANYLLPPKPLSEVYRAVFLRLVRSHPEPPQLPKIQWSKQWIANCRACTEGPANVLKYLARYTKRGPLPEKNILSVSDEQIAFRYISHQTKRPEECKVTPQEFLRRYLQHTLQPGFHRIRYYGFLAPGARRTLRGMRVALLTALTTLAPVITQLRERIENRSVQKCPRCGARCFLRINFTYPNRRAPPWKKTA